MAAQQPGGQSDNSAGILWGVAALFAVLGGIWFVFKTQLVSFYLLLKLYEVHLLNAITGDRYEQMHKTILIAMENAKKLTFSDIIAIGEGVGIVIRYPFVILMLVFAVVVYFSNTTRVFRRTYNMRDLAKLEKVNWPQISPVVGLDLVNTDIDIGPWAMSMTPMQFCKRCKLLEEVRPQRREGMSRKEWDRIDVVLKRGEANRIFVLQLGQLWSGPERLPPYARALFAAFAARINADKDGPALLTQLATTSSGSMDFSGMNALLNKHYNTKLVQAAVQSHAYVMTVMATMLERAREDGVQASSDFLWLKPVDRRLWYTLNVVGRQTPFAEVAGIFAHWVAEKEAGRKLIVPMVEEATRALELALKEVIYRPDEG